METTQSTLAPETSAQVLQLQDLSSGEVHKRDTSYLGEQNEVRDMIWATQRDQDRWPGYWYELLQGAWDYNDWDKGPPQINVYYKGQKEPVSLAQFVQDRQAAREQRRFSFLQPQLPVVAKVEVANHIKDGVGLKPNNVLLTQHEEKGDDPTLGHHGRGLKIATTATYAGDLAKKITFRSYDQKIGSWYGEAGFAKDPVDPDSPEYYQLRYKRDQNLRLNQTVISVEEPGHDLLESLAVLPDWFLPSNPRYRFQKLNPASQDQCQNNLTVFANPNLAVDSADSSFTSMEMQVMGLGHLSKIKGVEPARVEILPPETLSQPVEKIDFVFVDGLKVHVSGTEFSQIYSFWGFSHGNEGYNPKRSNDSLNLNGTVKDLIATSLKHCSNPLVWKRLIRGNLSLHSTHDGDLPRFQLSLSDPHVAKALVAGWQQLKESLGAPQEVYITNSLASKQRGDREKKPVIHVTSYTLTETLKKNVEGLIELDEIYEQEAAEARQQAYDAELRHREELEAERQKARDAEERHLRELQEAIEAQKKARGIEQEARETGEVLKVAHPASIEDAQELARLHLIHGLAVNQGEMRYNKTSGTYSFEMNADGYDRLPSNTNQLEDVGPFLQNFIAVHGASHDLEIRVVKKGRGVYFRFSRSNMVDDFGNITIKVQQGTLALNADNMLLIEAIPRPAKDTSFSQLFHTEDFFKQISQDIDSLKGEDGQIDEEKYLQSEIAQNFPPSLALIRTRRQLREAREQMEIEFALMNEKRRKAGLSEITLEAELPKPRRRTIADKELGIYEDAEGNSRPDVEIVMDVIYDDNRAFESPQIIDDIPLADRVVHLVHPDSIPGLSRQGKSERQRMIISQESLYQRLERSLKKKYSPDFSLASGEISKVRGYLLSHINPAYSTASTVEYQPVEDLKWGEQTGKVTLQFNKPLPKGMASLYCPPGYKPVGFYHPQGMEGAYFSGSREKNFYAVNFSADVQAGFTVYYERTDQIDRSIPDDKEKVEMVDFEDLDPHWQDLITALKASQMTDKQKVDILLQAWTKTFTYLDTQSAFDQYNRLMPKKFVAQIINKAEGNCGYSARGFHGLLSAAGFASREIAGYLADGNGGFDSAGNYHAMNQVYVEGRWVLIEPQVGWLERGFEVDSIPSNYRHQFNSLLEAIPNKRHIGVEYLFDESRRLTDLPQVLPDILPEVIPTINNSVRETIADIDRRGKKSFLKKSLIAVSSAYGVYQVGQLLVNKLSPWLPKLTAQAAEITPTPTAIPTATPTPAIPALSSPEVNPVANLLDRVVPEIIQKIPDIKLPRIIIEKATSPDTVPSVTPESLETFRHVIQQLPPELVAPLILVGAASILYIVAFLHGKYAERSKWVDKLAEEGIEPPEQNDAEPPVQPTIDDSSYYEL